MLNDVSATYGDSSSVTAFDYSLGTQSNGTNDEFDRLKILLVLIVQTYNICLLQSLMTNA